MSSPDEPLTIAPPVSARSEAAERLLDAGCEALLRDGLGDGSLRGMAQRLGTSHRMLIYHFGNGDAFWDAVLTRIRHNEQATRPSAPAAQALAVEAAILAAWERYSGPQYLPVIALLFELYGRAVHDRSRFQHFLDDVVTSWLQPLERAFCDSHGWSPEQARIRARLALAAMRGLLLDLITTGDREATTAAVQLLARTLAESAKA